MTEQEILDKLIASYPDLVHGEYPFPGPFRGKDRIKAIILGADPTHIVDGIPQQINMVFGLDKQKSPYWNGIARNIDQIGGLSVEDIYVQNVCRNYFKLETSKNKFWVEIAREYWIDFLKDELDKMFHHEVPILMTTEFILHASLIDSNRSIKAEGCF